MNKQKIAAVKRSLEKWIKQNTDYVLPTPKYIKVIIPIPYHRWYSGITKHENGKRLKEHLYSNPEYAGLYFKQLDVGTMPQANQVERYFSELGTKNKPESRGAREDSIYAYVFKADANLAEKILKFLDA
jgi:hypothetical protein